MSKFDVYALQDYVPTCIGTTENLADAEQLIKSQLSDQRDFFVYSQKTRVNIFYERTPDGFIACRSLKHSGDGVSRTTERSCARQKLLRPRNLWAAQLKSKCQNLLRKAAP